MPCTAARELAETLSASETTAWTYSLLRSAPMWAFMPKYHCLPLRVWCIFRIPRLVLVLPENGAWTILASASLPPAHRQTTLFKVWGDGLKDRPTAGFIPLTEGRNLLGRVDEFI